MQTRTLTPSQTFSATLNTVYKALIQPHFDYCSLVWYGRFNEDVRKLDVINKRCARVILGVNSFTPSDQMFRQLKWQSLKERCNYFTALMVFKCLNGLSPTYLQNKFKYVRDNHGCNTRQSTAGLLSLPPLSHGSEIESFKYCFSYNAVNVWNNIETSVRNSLNVQSFKHVYKTYYWN